LGTYHKEELAEKAEEDKFIYVFERKSQLKFKEDKKPSLPENEISYRQLIPLIQDKKRLVLRYSLFFNLVAVAGIVIIGFTPHTEYPASILPMFIPFFLYWLVLTTFGYSPIKSYRFWTKLEKHIEKFVIDKGSDKTDLPVINYEEIHRKVMEENKK
jgi:hypothetical protein